MSEDLDMSLPPPIPGIQDESIFEDRRESVGSAEQSESVFVKEELAASPDSPFDDAISSKKIQDEPFIEAEIPLPADSSDVKYSPTKAACGDASPSVEGAQPKKAPAVLSVPLAKKRLQAYSRISAAKLSASSSTSSVVKKSPVKGISVFSGRHGDSSKQPTLAIAAIKEEETKMKEILAMNSVKSDKFKATLPPNLYSSSSGGSPVTAIVKPLQISESQKSSAASEHGSKTSYALSVIGSRDRKPLESSSSKRSIEHKKGRRSSSNSSKSLSKSRSRSPGRRRRSGSRDRELRNPGRESREQQKPARGRSRDRDIRGPEKSRRSRSRGRSSDGRRGSRRSRSPRPKEKYKRRSRSRSQERKRRSPPRRSRDRSPSRNSEADALKARERKRRAADSSPSRMRESSPSPGVFKDRRISRSRSPSIAKKRRGRTKSRSPEKERQRSSSTSLDRSRNTDRSRTEKHKQSPSNQEKRKSSSKSDRKDKEYERNKEREKQKDAERRREAELLERQRELDRVRKTRLPMDWTDYKRYDYSDDHIRELKKFMSPLGTDKPTRTNSDSLSPSSSVHSRAGSVSENDEKFVGRVLIQQPKVLETVPMDSASGRQEYPTMLLKTTKQKPPLIYGANPLSYAGYYKSRQHVMKAENPDIVDCMLTIIQGSTTITTTSSASISKQQFWYAEQEQHFCPAEGATGIVISHLYSDEEVDDSPREGVRKKDSSRSISGELQSSHSEPLEEDYSSASSPSQDSMPSPLLKRNFEEDDRQVTAETKEIKRDRLPLLEKLVPDVKPKEGKSASEVSEIPREAKSKKLPKELKKKKKKKEHKHHHKKEHRRKQSSGGETEETLEKADGSDDSVSDSSGSDSKKKSDKKVKKEEEDVPSKSSRVQLKVDKKRETSSKIKKQAKKSKKKHRHRSDSETTSSSSSDTESSDDSDTSKEKRKKKKKRRKKKSRSKSKKSRDDSTDDENEDRDKGSKSGGSSHKRSNMDPKDGRGDESEDRDRRKSKNGDKQKSDKKRSSKHRRHSATGHVDALGEPLSGNDEHGESTNSDSESSSSSSSSGSNSSDASKLLKNLQEEHSLNDMLQGALEDVTNPEALSKLLMSIDAVVPHTPAIVEKYDPFSDIEPVDSPAAVKQEDFQRIPVTITSRYSCSPERAFSTGAQDLLKLTEGDDLLDMVLSQNDISAENILASIGISSGADIAELDELIAAANTPPDEKSELDMLLEDVSLEESVEMLKNPAPIPVLIPPVPSGPNRRGDRFSGLEGRRSPPSRESDRRRRRSRSRSHSLSPHSRSPTSRSRSFSRSRSRSVSPMDRRRRSRIDEDRRYRDYSDRYYDKSRSYRRSRREMDNYSYSRSRDRDRGYYEDEKDRKLGSYRSRHREDRFEHSERYSSSAHADGYDSSKAEKSNSHKYGFYEDPYSAYPSSEHEPGKFEIHEHGLGVIEPGAPPVYDDIPQQGSTSNEVDSNSMMETVDGYDMMYQHHVYENNRRNPSNLREIRPAQTWSSMKEENGRGSPKRPSLDERLEMEMGISLQDDLPPRFGPFSAYQAQNLPQPPAAQGAPANIQMMLGWASSKDPYVQDAPVRTNQTGPPQQSQAIPFGDIIQVLPGEMLNRTFTVTKENCKANPIVVQQTADQVIRKEGDEVHPKKCIMIKVPVIPFKIPMAKLDSLNMPEEESLEDIKSRIREERKAEKKKRSELKKKRLLRKKLEKRKMMKKYAHEEKVRLLREERLSDTQDSSDQVGDGGRQSDGDEVPKIQDNEIMKEEDQDHKIGLDCPTNEESPSNGNAVEITNDRSEAAESNASVDVGVTRLENAMEVGETDVGKEEEQDSGSPPQPAYEPIPLPVLENTEAPKGILMIAGFRRGNKSSKGVKFVDGVHPGYGSSKSEVEEIHSPPLVPKVKVLVKKKEKKKKVRTAIDEERKKKLKQLQENEFIESQEPPPPPKTPYPYCPLGILYQFNPPYAVLYAQALVEHGFEVTFTPSIEEPKAVFYNWNTTNSGDLQLASVPDVS